MSRNKRDVFDRKFFSFRDQLSPRYGYEDAKKLAYAFIKLLRKYKSYYVGLHHDVYNLRCCDTNSVADLIKYERLRNPRYGNGEYGVDVLTTVNNKVYRIGFDYGYD